MQDNRSRRLLLFPGGVRRDAEIESWFDSRPDQLAAIARRWFGVMRSCGEDVRELLHDGHPTVCVDDAGFGYVNAFTSHVNVGFFRGAELEDPDGVLEGGGKFMRHVKLQPNSAIDEAALTRMIEAAYEDIKR